MVLALLSCCTCREKHELSLLALTFTSDTRKTRPCKLVSARGLFVTANSLHSGVTRLSRSCSVRGLSLSHESCRNLGCHWNSSYMPLHLPDSDASPAQ